MSEIYKYIQMNPDGFFVLNNEAITDKDYGRQLLESMTMDSRHRPVVTFQGVHAYVEAFDEPLIVQQVEFNNQKWNAICLYDFSANFYLDSLSLDEWDRFHGITEQGVPFVFSRKAQNEFFNLLDEFDDDSITFQEKVYTPPLWPGCNADVEKESFWSQKYSEMDPPGWELGEPAKPLVEVLL